MRELELLAPARTADIGIAAIDCGADAVYIAGPEFGARQAAGNSFEDIERLCSYAHRFGARIFAALNTIIYDSETDRACEAMARLQEAGADAIIIQDLGLSPAAVYLADAARDIRIPLHASTQCAIRTPERAAFLEKLGFSRLILERELSLEQIRQIRDTVSCELEFFVHGALCVCYSGQCYISEQIAGRSANRGACIQACRSLYNLKDSEGKTLVSGKPLLSLKDYNLKDRLEDLAESGISSFKIEGRLKSMSYVRNVVREYSMALDRLVEKHPGKYARSSFGKARGGFVPQPGKTFNRGYTDLFIDGKRGQWASGDAATSMGEPVGRVRILSPDKTRIRIIPDRKDLVLNNGDGLCFVTGKQEVAGFRADVCTNLDIRCKPVPELFDGAMIYRNIDTAFEKELETDKPVRTLRVTIDISESSEAGRQELEITAVSEDGRTCRLTAGSGSEMARDRENMARTLTAQLSKTTGHYSFQVENISARELPFMPVSAVNSLRRDIAGKLDEEPCRARPLYKAAFRPETLSSCGEQAGIISYKDNIANRRAAGLMEKLGASSIEPAYELTHRPDAELMRTRYCIKYQFGKCPRHHGHGWTGKLFLENNGRRFPLRFDCENCEMAVMAPSS